MTVQQAMLALDANPNDDTLNAFIMVVSDALARGETVPDAAMRRYKLATGGAQPLPTVTITEPAGPTNEPVPWLKLGLLALGIGFLVMTGAGDDEGDDDGE